MARIGYWQTPTGGFSGYEPADSLGGISRGGGAGWKTAHKTERMSPTARAAYQAASAKRSAELKRKAEIERLKDIREAKLKKTTPEGSHVRPYGSAAASAAVARAYAQDLLSVSKVEKFREHRREHAEYFKPGTAQKYAVTPLTMTGIRKEKRIGEAYESIYPSSIKTTSVDIMSDKQNIGVVPTIAIPHISYGTTTGLGQQLKIKRKRPLFTEKEHDTAKTFTHIREIGTRHETTTLRKARERFAKLTPIEAATFGASIVLTEKGAPFLGKTLVGEGKDVMVGELAEGYMRPKETAEQTFTRGVSRGFQSPVFAAEIMLAAPLITSKILAARAAAPIATKLAYYGTKYPRVMKGIDIGMMGLYAGPKTVKAYGHAAAGETGLFLGEAITTSAGLLSYKVGGVLARKSYLKSTLKKEIESKPAEVQKQYKKMVSELSSLEGKKVKVSKLSFEGMERIPPKAKPIIREFLVSKDKTVSGSIAQRTQTPKAKRSFLTSDVDVYTKTKPGKVAHELVVQLKAGGVSARSKGGEVYITALSGKSGKAVSFHEYKMLSSNIEQVSSEWRTVGSRITKTPEGIKVVKAYTLAQRKAVAGVIQRAAYKGEVDVPDFYRLLKSMKDTPQPTMLIGRKMKGMVAPTKQLSIPTKGVVSGAATVKVASSVTGKKMPYLSAYTTPIKSVASYPVPYSGVSKSVASYPVPYSGVSKTYMNIPQYKKKQPSIKGALYPIGGVPKKPYITKTDTPTIPKHGKPKYGKKDYRGLRATSATSIIKIMPSFSAVQKKRKPLGGHLDTKRSYKKHKKRRGVSFKHGKRVFSMKSPKQITEELLGVSVK